MSGSTAEEISRSVESGVRDGSLAPGSALPPVRTLAGELGVAPATVAAAYKALRQRGVVETAGRNGTRVRSRPPVATNRLPAPKLPPGVRDLASGEPDRALLPPVGPRLRQLASVASEPLGYNRGATWPELVELAAVRFAADGIPAGAVTVTSGALDAMERLLTAHLRPGDRVAVEDPGWGNLIDLIAALGLERLALPVDQDGPTTAGLERALNAGASAVIVTSRAQNPLGGAVTPHRAAELRPLLGARPGVLLIEDDHAAELADEPLAPLAGAGPSWAFVRSASKPYGPDLRVAVLAGDEASIARVEGRLRLGAGWVSTLLQRLLVAMWRDEAVSALVARARQSYLDRRGAVLRALSERGIPAVGRSGFNVWVPVPDETAAVAALRDHGLAVAAGSRHRLESPSGLRVTVSAVQLSEVDGLADRIAAALLSSAVEVSPR